MADRTVTVRLRALVDDYKKAMGDAGRATTSAADKAGNFKKLGQSTANLGDSLTRNLTVPLIAAGAAAVKMSLDFDSTFAQMQATAGVSAGEVDGLKESVLGLAGETARSPQELAEALMMIRSSGFDGAAAMDVLEMSAKGAASGMGETSEVANAITNVLNGYGQANITAAEAMDVLTASVQEGKAEASDMAPQFGRLVPIAAELGVSFSDVGGSLAFLTKATGDASQSSTALQGILSKLLRPSVQGAEALRDIGLSAADLREMLAERGLHGTLMALREQLGDTGFQMLFDDVQALNGALQMTGPGAEDAAAVIEAVGDSAGATDTAFQKMAESAGFQNAQAFSKLQAAMIKFGDAIVPIVADVAGFIGRIADAFTELPGPVQKAIVGLVAFAAALGPIMSVGGRLASVATTVYEALSKIQRPAETVGGSFDGASVNAGRFSSALSRIAVAAGTLGILAVGSRLIAEFVNPVDTANLSQLENKILDFAQSGRVGGEAADVMGEDLDKLADAMHRVGEPSTGQRLTDIGSNLTTFGGDTRSLEQARQRIDDVDKSLATLTARDPEAAARGFERISEAMQEQGISASQVDEMFDDYASALAETDTAQRTAADGAEETTEAYGAQATAVDAAVASLQEYSDALTAQFDPLFGMMDALTGNADANRALGEAQTALNEARDAGDPAAIAEAEIALSAAQREAVGSALGVSQATATMNQAIAENPALLESSKSQLATWVDQGLITQATADEMATKFDLTALSAAALNDSDANVDVSSTGTAETGERLEGVTKRATAIPKSRNTATTTTGTDTSRSSLEGVTKAAGRIPKTARTATTTSGTVPARSALNDVAGAANGIPRNVTITVATKHVGSPVPKRAEGGPVRARQTYLVGEDGPELLTIGAQSGTVHPNSVLEKMTGDYGSNLVSAVAAPMGGDMGTNVLVNVSMAGAIIASEADAQRWVAQAWNKAASFGMVNLRGKALA
jgi:TP901 family phage tail tape measure protein